MRSLRLAPALAMLLSAAVAHATGPAGWFLAGNDPGAYEIGRDSVVTRNKSISGRLSSTAKSKGFGTMMQSIEAAEYAGKRVRLSAYVKTRDVTGWVGLWMRVDDASKPPQALAFDNMQSRALRKTVDWTPCSVVLDVDPKAQGISFGILMADEGTAWLNELRFEVVPTSVPTTGVVRSRRPANLDFER